MAWAVKTPEGEVRLMDLPLEVLDKIEHETDMRWTDILVAPAASARCALAVYAAACEQTGAEPEQLTPARLVDDELFFRAEDDLPESYQDGIPKAEGEALTSGSSGAPNDTDGPQK